MPPARARRLPWLALFVVIFAGAPPGSAADTTLAPLRGAPHATIGCPACHGEEMPPDAKNPRSPVAARDIASMCGTCHAEEKNRYVSSSHGRGVAKGDGVSPTCVSCHGSHRIFRVAEPASPTSPTHVVSTCAECHEDAAVIHAANLPSATVEHYEETLHGTAQAHGVSDVPTCVSCHGAHQVLPASDPRSRLHASNIADTCGGCHASVTPAMIAAVRHAGQPPTLHQVLAAFRVHFPIAGTTVNAALVSGMGALVGFLSGVFGVGGGFLLTPLLIFIGIPAAVAAATDAAQITAGATSGAISHSRLGNVDYKMGLFIVLGGWTGGYLGVKLVRVLRALGNFDFFLRLVYVLILGFIGLAMFVEGVRALRGREASGEPRRSRLTRVFSRLPFQVTFQKSGLRISALLPAAAGFLVGMLAAFLGVGGGFIMLPAMIYIIGIPTRVAVGTDLFQIVLTSANVTLQQAMTNFTVDVLLAVTLFAGSTVGAQFGVLVSRRLRGEQIRVFLSLIVLIVMSMLLYQLVAPPAQLVDFAKPGGGH